MITSKKTFNIEKDALPSHLDDFSKALQLMFGVGAHSLEQACLKRFYTKLAALEVCRGVCEMEDSLEASIKRIRLQNTRTRLSQTANGEEPWSLWIGQSMKWRLMLFEPIFGVA
jgi:hypothetical protein